LSNDDRPSVCHKSGGGGGESIEHKTAKGIIADAINSRTLSVIVPLCGNLQHLPPPSVLEFPHGTQAAFELQEEGGRAIVDVAARAPDGSVSHVFEVMWTHATVTPRAAVWFEIRAEDVIDGWDPATTALVCRRYENRAAGCGRSCPECEKEAERLALEAAAAEAAAADAARKKKQRLALEAAAAEAAAADAARKKTERLALEATAAEAAAADAARKKMERLALEAVVAEAAAADAAREKTERLAREKTERLAEQARKKKRALEEESAEEEARWTKFSAGRQALRDEKEAWTRARTAEREMNIAWLRDNLERSLEASETATVSFLKRMRASEDRGMINFLFLDFRNA
jgi:flagellar biosynthesis GTPase FlhF